MYTARALTSCHLIYGRDSAVVYICLLLLPLCFFLCWSLFCSVNLGVLSSLAIILVRKGEMAPRL